MDLKRKERFLELWPRYFGSAKLPIVFYYTDRDDRAERVPAPHGHQCVIGPLAQARKGRSLTFDVQAVGCGGGKRYLGFSQEAMPHFEHFLSCGIPGHLEGERYKKSPELVKAFVEHVPPFLAPARHIVFKRWDTLDEADSPEVVIFFAPPDVISGLFTLANFDEAGPHGVICPFCAGCGAIVRYPYLEARTERSRAVLGMFDVSARPYVPGEVLTFAVPMRKFLRMLEDMEQSFLTTASWQKVRQRIA